MPGDHGGVCRGGGKIEESSVTRLNIRCCCKPKVILGTVELPFVPDRECDVLVDGKMLKVREYYELRQSGGHYYREWAVEAHGESA